MRVRLILLLFCTALGPLSWAPQPNQHQDALIRDLQERGGRILRDETLPNKPVVEIDLHRLSMTDATLATLTSFPTLKSLDISHTLITNKGMAYLAGLHQLQAL